MPRLAPAVRCACVALIGLLLPAAASAAGIEYGPQGVHAIGRGGAFVVGADDPSAIWWNPSRLSLMRGTQMLYDHNLPSLSLTFDRDPAKRCTNGPGNSTCEGDATPTTFARARQQNGVFPVGINFGLTSDFGLKDWGFGLGVQGPAAYGTMAYADNPSKGDPSAISAARYSISSMDTALIFVSAAAAWKYKEWFGLGVSLQYVAVPYLKYSLDIVGPASASTQNDPGKTINDLRVDLNMADWKKFSAVVGGWARPLPYLEFGMSARVIPVNVTATGDLTISGTENSIYARMVPVKVPGRVSFTYPVDVKVGGRYVHKRADRELFDIEADFVWEQWSAHDGFHVKFDKQDVEALGTQLKLKKITLLRNLNDTYSVRLGGTYNPIADHMWVRLGGWWEKGAQPNNRTIIDLPSWDRFGIGAGISGAYRGVQIGISYAHVFQLARTVAAGTGLIKQQVLDFAGTMNDGYSVNEGKYTSSFDIVSVGITIGWEELVHGKKPGAPAAPAAPAPAASAAL